MIPEAVRAWAQEHLPAEIVAVEPVTGGLTETISAVHLREGGPVVLRYLPVETWGETGHAHVTCEELGCRLMEGSVLPVPRLIATEPDANRPGAYASLTTWLPGTARLDHLGLAAIDELARAAAIIHATPVAEDRRPRPYQFWVPADPEPPDWSERPNLWRHAIELFAAGPPPTREGLIHRDFHPGNVLWAGDRITGVIDWAETSWGPPDLDVAHSRTNFAILHDQASADAFGAAYDRHGGPLDADPAAVRFWAVADILGFLPDPGLLLVALLAQRRDLDVPTVRHRLEKLLERTLSDL